MLAYIQSEPIEFSNPYFVGDCSLTNVSWFFHTMRLMLMVLTHAACAEHSRPKPKWTRLWSCGLPTRNATVMLLLASTTPRRVCLLPWRRASQKSPHPLCLLLHASMSVCHLLMAAPRTPLFLVSLVFDLQYLLAFWSHLSKCLVFIFFWIEVSFVHTRC